MLTHHAAGGHRYILLLFAQPANFTVDAIAGVLNTSTPISNFNISAFAEQTGLGSPLAGNFFLTGPDANSTSTASGATGSSTSPAGGAAGANSALGIPELSLAGATFAMGLLGMLLL